MAGVKLFYGSTSGNTLDVALLLETALSDVIRSVNNIAEVAPEDLQDADALILGVSTWDIGALQKDWARFFPGLDKVDLHGKKVALFGLGDAKGFSGLFVNALRTLYDKVKERGADIIGQWPTAGYEFDYSAAIEDGQFVGLVIDQENQSDLTVQRIGEWAALIRPLLTGKSKRDPDPKYDKLG